MKDMTKVEIVAELTTYGVNATIRARKATLVSLLKEKREDAAMKMGVKTKMDEIMEDDMMDMPMEKDESMVCKCMHSSQAIPIIVSIIVITVLIIAIIL